MVKDIFTVRRYAKVQYMQSSCVRLCARARVCVCVCVCHTPVLYQNG